MNIELEKGIVENFTFRDVVIGRTMDTVASFNFKDHDCVFEIRGYKSENNSKINLTIKNSDLIAVAFQRNNVRPNTIRCIYRFEDKQLIDFTKSALNLVAAAIFAGYISIIVACFIKHAGLNSIAIISAVYFVLFSPVFIIITYGIFLQYNSSKKLLNFVKS